MKCVDNISLFEKKNSFNIGIIYFPIQKSLKILPNISSTSTFPTIILSLRIPQNSTLVDN